jgi:hypothetical protein
MIRLSGTRFLRNDIPKQRHMFFRETSSADDTVGSERSKHVVRVMKAGWQAERLHKLMKCQDQYFALPSHNTAPKPHYRRHILTNASMKKSTALHFLFSFHALWLLFQRPPNMSHVIQISSFVRFASCCVCHYYVNLSLDHNNSTLR